MNERRILVRNTFFYTATQLLTKSINLLLIPIFVGYLSQKAFGIVNLILVAITFFTLLTIGGMTEALMRFYAAASLKRLKGIVLTTVLIICLVFGFILALTSLILEDRLAIWIFDSEKYIPFIVPIVVYGLLESINQIMFTIIRAEKRIKRYNISILIKTLSYLIFTVITLVFLHLGVQGFLISLVLSSVIVVMINLVFLIKRLHFEFHQRIFRMILGFGLPYLLTGLSLQLLFKIDHVILKFLISLEAVAVYGLSYMLGSSIQYLNIAFSYAWYPHLFNLSSKEKMRNEIATIFNLYVVLLIPIGLSLTAGNYHILPSLLPQAYKEAISIIPWIIWGYFLYGLLDFFGAGLVIKYKTKTLSLITLSAALLNVLLNFILIARFGILGAAMATFISFIFILSVAYYFSNRIFRINYQFKKLSKAIGIYVIIFLLGELITFENQSLNVLLAIFHIMILIVSPFLFNFIDYNKVKLLFTRK
jgi:O-antigen/teichoic acid export membrane protein